MLDEESLFTLFEMTPDLVCIVNRTGYFKRINPAVGNTLGYSMEELMAFPVSHFIYPLDKERTAANRIELLNGRPLLNFQNRYQTKNGEVVWLEWTSIYLPDKELVFAIAKNITKGKVIEIELLENLKSMQLLNRHVKQHTEKHRQKIAGALHEDMSQIATAIKMKVEWVTNQEHDLTLNNHELLVQTLGAATQLLDKLRNLSYSLYPAPRTIQGVNESLGILCKDFGRRSGICCVYKSRCSGIFLSEEEMADAHWICQEALQNVQEHAAASQVTVFIRQTKSGLLLTICDNGTGFDPSSVEFSGISVMKARALSIHATLSVESKAGGTTISLLMKGASPSQKIQASSSKSQSAN
jgi:PAS domain S-box-containing protein